MQAEGGKSKGRREVRTFARRAEQRVLLGATLNDINEMIEDFCPKVLYELGQQRQRMAAGIQTDESDLPSPEEFELIPMANRLKSRIARITDGDVKQTCFDAWDALGGFLAVNRDRKIGDQIL